MSVPGFGAIASPDSRNRTSAVPPGLRASLPPKMTSSIFSPRRLLALCSPSTQVMASATLLLPQPFGPTIAVTPSSKASSDRSEKDLNPEISRRSRRMLSPCASQEKVPRPAFAAEQKSATSEWGRRSKAGDRSARQKARASLTRPSPSGKTVVTPQYFGLGPKWRVGATDELRERLGCLCGLG